MVPCFDSPCSFVCVTRRSRQKWLVGLETRERSPVIRLPDNNLSDRVDLASLSGGNKSRRPRPLLTWPYFVRHVYGVFVVCAKGKYRYHRTTAISVCPSVRLFVYMYILCWISLSHNSLLCCLLKHLGLWPIAVTFVVVYTSWQINDCWIRAWLWLFIVESL